MSTRIVNDRFVVTHAEPKRGGSSIVNQALDLQQGNRLVALKLLSGQEYSPPEVDLFFEREKQALMALQHPNIVQLVDAGRDDQTSEYYLALEWVDSTLPEWLQGEIPPFDDFVEKIAFPLARALEFAHEHLIVHRDIKPSNVLLASDETPKLADFGISKIKNALTGGPLTTAQFGSRPYAAPEASGTASFARDVYGFGVLMLACLTDVSLNEYHDIQAALDELDVTPKLHALIERCVAFDPAVRPQSGQLLFYELEDIQRLRRAKHVEQQTVHLGLTATARTIVGEALESSDETEIAASLEGDLNDAPWFRVLTSPDESPDAVLQRHFFLAGSRWSLRVTPEGKPARVGTRGVHQDVIPHQLLAIGARQLEPVDGDWNRDRVFTPSGFTFSFRHPSDYEKAFKSLRALIAAADVDHRERELQREARAETRLFEEWTRQLDARNAVEGGKEAPLEYVSVRRDRHRAIFTVGSLQGQDVEVEERRQVKVADRRLPIKGVVDFISSGEVTLYLDKDPESIPTRGALVRDTAAARSVISRERDALNAVRHQGPLLVRPDLPRLIIHPEDSAVPGEVTVDDRAWLQDELDDDKRAAVRAALGSPDFFVVQGPPGTGKTTLITELIAQEIRRNPSARILLTSQTNVALDNALAKLDTHRVTDRLVRLAGPTGISKVALDVQPLVLDNRLSVWSKDVRDKSTRYIEERAGEFGIRLNTARAVLKLTRLHEVRQEEAALQAELSRLRDQIRQTSDPQVELSESPGPAALQDLYEERSQRAERLQQLGRDATLLTKEIAELHPEELADVEECTAEEARFWADVLLPEHDPGSAQLRELVALQGKWLERLGRSDQFQASLLAAMHVVAGTCIGVAGFEPLSSIEFDLCILDEASKATATEALVPAVRARRWVLVGDRKQLPPFQEDALRDAEIQEEYDLDPSELKRTLFDRLADGLPDGCMAMLRTQHRMTTAIGDLISQCFYDGELINRGPPPLLFPSHVLAKPVVWLSTSQLPSHFERRVGVDAAPSYLNTTEATQVINFLDRLNLAGRQQGKRTEVLVLSPYRPQVAEINNRATARTQDWDSLAVEVKSVDAAQGREADIVVFSVTRSNRGRQVGFLTLEARANVALSRGRLGLVIIGDHAFCASRTNPLARVLEHIQNHSDTCALEVLT